MLLMMLEKNMPVDIILFCDTGLEFPDMYKHLEKVEKYTGRKITKLKAPFSFEYYFLDVIVKRKNAQEFIEKYGALHNGNSWPGPRQRWLGISGITCTSIMQNSCGNTGPDILCLRMYWVCCLQKTKTVRCILIICRNCSMSMGTAQSSSR